MIDTDNGERPIEKLCIGDMVRTVSGPSLPVRWLAHQLCRKTGPEWAPQVAPVRIRQFALDDETPRRDLFLSPAHRLMIDSYLIEVRDLVNGTSITAEQPPSAELEYFHVLLDRHEVLLAEGASAASLQLDLGSMEEFSNVSEYERMHCSETLTRMAPCAPTLGVGGKEHLKALLRIGASPFISLRDPMADIYERVARRGELLFPPAS